MSYLVRKTNRGFRVVQEVRTPQGKSVKTIKKIAYKRLGFSAEMSLDQAKLRAKQINAQHSLEAKSIAGIAERVELNQTQKSAYLPSADVARFENELAEIYADNSYRHEINIRYWRAAQRAILKLAVDPNDFKTSHARFINYFREQKWSHDYIKRITRILDMWGMSVSRHRGAHYDPIPKLSSVQVQRIADFRETIQGVRVPAEPLEWVALKSQKDKFQSEGLELQWNWMMVATWFGLRPLEVDNLKNSKFMKLERDKKHGVEVLCIYQTKLTSVASAKRWKRIPIYHPEQKAALKLISDGEIKRPLNKSLRRLLGAGIETYSPRKGFTDLMLSLGWNIEDISTFLGHHSIDMTWRHYKDRKSFNLPRSG